MAGPGTLEPPKPLQGQYDHCVIVDVIEGDYLRIRCRGQGHQYVWVAGYDTPELHEHRCRAEQRRAREAKFHVIDALYAAQRVELVGNRRVSDGALWLEMRIDGRDVADDLISRAMAVPYNGGPRIDWCRRLR